MNFFDMITYSKNKSITENGAIGYNTTGSTLLDMSFKLSSYRNLSDHAIIEDVKKAYQENAEATLKFLFYARDISQGCGERRFFRVAMSYLFNMNCLPYEVLKQIPEFGRWDDLVYLATNNTMDNIAYQIIAAQLAKDIDDYNEGKPISLLAKWMPSINASSVSRKAQAYKFMKTWKLNAKEYRIILSCLRKYLDIVERKMSANEWSKIDYNKVPAIANLKYNKAFMKQDCERRTKYFRDLSQNKEGVKINAKTLMPYQIVRSYLNNTNSATVCQELWKNMPTMEINNKTIVVADGSGSMYSCANKNVRPIEVAYSLAMYFAEKLTGSFHNKFITFSSHPQVVSFKDSYSFEDKVKVLENYDDISNTNIEAVFDLILNTARKNNITPEEMIDNILIISDMEFDDATTEKCDQALFDVISYKYNRYGYRMPKLTFWNVDSRTNTIPVTENENGVALVSGFSQNAIKIAMTGETDPYKALMEILNSNRYSKICIKK